jgi:PQQ-dependent catabolism-associated CXXCW motif protein
MYRFTGCLALLLATMASIALAQPQPMPIPPQFGAPAPSPGSPGGYSAPSPAPTPANQAGGNCADETTDFGVRPQTELQSNVGSPTPTTIPGAQVLTTAQLHEGMQGGITLLLVDSLLDPNNMHQTLPGAMRLPYAGQPGNFNDQIQQRLQADLAQATKQRQDMPIIFFCAGPNCWESYNTALRAVRLGYQKVFWYHGGLAAWQAAGLPLMGGAMPGNPNTGMSPSPDMPGGGLVPNPSGGIPPAGNPASVMPPAQEPRSVVAAAPKGWVAHEDPMGFSAQIPKGWRAQSHPKGWVQINGPDGEQIVVWPVFIPVALDAQSAPTVLQNVVAAVWPNAQWDKPHTLGAGAARMTGRSGNHVGVAAITWVAGREGSAAYVYTMSAPADRYKTAATTLADILQRFRAKGPGATEPLEGTRFVTWQEPQEHAVTVEVPDTWSVQGGMFRVAATDVRVGVLIVSPDEKIRIGIGDSRVGAFSTPIPPFFPEGSPYPLGAGVTLQVMRYLPGKDFCAWYVRSLARDQHWSDLAFTDGPNAKELAQAEQVMNQLSQQLRITYSVGEVMFTAKANGQPVRGHYGAMTLNAATTGSTLWSVPGFAGYVATTDRAELAEAVFSKIRFVWNPQWQSNQSDLALRVSKIWAGAQEEIGQKRRAAYEYQAKTVSEAMQKWSDRTLDVTRVTDPASGREMAVKSGANYYWMDYRGNIVGTDTYTRPAFEFRELTKLP